MQDVYLTIDKPTEGLYKEKGSKFLAFAYPCISKEEVKVQLDALRKTYYDARHHCYAYVLGNTGSEIRANDDGEPSHSAGDPILGQIKSRNLTNILVVVVRYFGGTKLGVSGLIHAYKTATSEALNGANIIEKQITESVRFRFPYEEMNEVMKLVKEFGLQITTQGYDQESTLEVEVQISRLEALKNKHQLLRDTGSNIYLKEL